MASYYIMFFGVTFFIFVLYFVLSVILRHLSNENAAIQKKPLVKMEATVIDKFFDGEEITIGGSPTLLINVKLKQTNHQIKHYVEQKLYMKYDIGDKIEVFVNQNRGIKIYPVDELKGVA
ncbi:MAG: hypothetical protein NE334_05040 [Lentisphaeraceae bacterium]|nr:hypothetical protein [Lentisphaeraceae bacterium]